jgi:succinate dehydrogenase / fumarate reductase membrane anchor subunit
MIQQVGSTHRGLKPWLLQRLSALYMAFYVIYLVLWFCMDPITDYAGWRQWNGAGLNRLALGVFVFSALLHAWIGMRSVYLDYLKPLWLRFAVSVVTGGGLMVIGMWFAEVMLHGAAP